MLPIAPGQSATVLVALATIAGIPSPTRAGNVTSVPPPVMAFMAPPITAEITTSRSRIRSMPEGVGFRSTNESTRPAVRRDEFAAENMTSCQRPLAFVRDKGTS